MLSDIQACKQKPTESPDVFSNRYKTLVFRYVNQLTVAHKGDNHQCAVMLLSNALLTPDTLNALTFQLTAGASIAKRKSFTVTLDATVVNNMASAILSRAPVDESQIDKEMPEDL